MAEQQKWSFESADHPKSMNQTAFEQFVQFFSLNAHIKKKEEINLARRMRILTALFSPDKKVPDLT